MDWFNDLFIEEAKAALSRPAGNSSGGGLTKLPEGYPYKEGVTIEWDGNTEGLDSVGDGPFVFYRVSDEIISNEALKKCTVTVSNGANIAFSDYWEMYEQGGLITEDVSILVEMAGIIVRTSNFDFNGMIFEKAGVYFMRSDTVYTKRLSCETIYPLSEKYVPYEATVKDWNEIDETARAYIKNRPCYNIEQDAISLEVTQTLISGSGNYIDCGFSNKFTPGERYRVYGTIDFLNPNTNVTHTIAVDAIAIADADKRLCFDEANCPSVTVNGDGHIKLYYLFSSDYGYTDNAANIYIFAYSIGKGISWSITLNLNIAQVKMIDSIMLPKAAAVADVTEAPTAEEFNALLASLRAAGYLAT